MLSIPAYSANLIGATSLDQTREEMTRRGISVYTASEAIGITGRAKDGQVISGQIEVPFFGLSIIDRMEIAQKCDAVFGVVTGRMSRIAGLEWSVIRESKVEDRTEQYLKQCKQLFDEYASSAILKYRIIRFRMVQEIMMRLPDVLPDLSNFQAALLRWKKRIEQKNDDATTEIEDWLHQPNPKDNFDDFVRKWVFDLLIHGGVGIFKDRLGGERLEAMYPLPGGTVVPLSPRFVGPERAYAQVIAGMDPKIYFPDEMIYSTYMPTSGTSYGLIPLEALVNKVAETLFFDRRAAEMADGTKPPDKVAVFGGEKLPFGGLNDDPSMEIPLTHAEESKLETLLNEPRKNAIRVLSGYGTPAVLDLSGAETFASQSERQRFIRETVAFVYNATNMEVNLTGSADTSGRATSESQALIEREKGIYPIVKDIENDLNFQALPFRFGSGYLFQYKSGFSDKEQAELDMLKMRTGTYGVNEVRMDRGSEPFGPEFDQPKEGVAAGPGMTPDGSEASPLNIRSM